MSPAGAPAKDVPVAPVALTPSSAWNVDWDREACRLQRRFGVGDESVVVSFIRHGPFRGFDMLISGRSLTATGKDKLAYVFGPDGGRATEVDNAFFGTAPDGVTTWQFGAGLLGAEWELKDDPDEAELDRQYQTRLAQVRRLTLTKGLKRPLALDFGSLAKPMAAVEACMDDLMASWGLDPAVQRALRERPKPRTAPAGWVKNGDYPVDMARKGVSGKLQFRLMIDATGAVTSCTMQAIYTDSAFESAVCPKLKKRARFHPALDADGRPVASFWNSSVAFVTAG